MEIQISEKKKSPFPDRVNLTPEQSKRLESWVQQIKEATQGALRISKSDLVNFVLAEMTNSLSEEQMIRLEIKFYNETRWLAWAMGQIKASGRSKDKVSLEELLKARQERWKKNKREISVVIKQATMSKKKNETDFKESGTKNGTNCIEV